MESLFNQLTEKLCAGLADNEQLVINFQGEDSLFIRFNHAKVRQITDVQQMELQLTLKTDGKQSSMGFPLGNNLEADLQRCHDTLQLLRERVADLTPLPFFVDVKSNGTSRAVYEGELLSSQDYVAIITEAAKGLDMAGLLISGSKAIGNANSKGQRHWFHSTSFSFDYSLYNAKEKAVKAAYSGTRFETGDFIATLEEARRYLAHMDKPNRVLPPGKYACYLAPAAVSEILGTFSWGGASQSSLKRGNSPLQQISDGDAVLAEHFSLSEDFSLGLHPTFNSDGEVTAEHLPIFERGQLKNLLTSSRTAKEYALTSNFSDDSESLRSPVIATGDLTKSDILKQLDHGIYLSNLHYLNWSDIRKGRITGMTRFACFLVENGEIVAPIKDLRFDETLYNIWGKNLLAVTDFADTEVTTLSYNRRSAGGNRCPGMLVKDFNFTL